MSYLLVPPHHLAPPSSLGSWAEVVGDFTAPWRVGERIIGREQQKGIAKEQRKTVQAQQGVVQAETELERERSAQAAQETEQARIAAEIAAAQATLAEQQLAAEQERAALEAELTRAGWQRQDTMLSSASAGARRLGTYALLLGLGYLLIQEAAP